MGEIYWQQSPYNSWAQNQQVRWFENLSKITGMPVMNLAREYEIYLDLFRGLAQGLAQGGFGRGGEGRGGQLSLEDLQQAMSARLGGQTARKFPKQNLFGGQQTTFFG